MWKKKIQENIEFKEFSDDDEIDNDNEPGWDGTNDVELNYYNQQKDVLRTVSEQYIHEIVSNLEDQFQDGGLLDNMKVIVPSNIINNTCDIARYGFQDGGLLDNMKVIVPSNIINNTCDIARYGFQDGGLLDNMKVIVPSNIINNTCDIARYGESQIKTLATHFSVQHKINVEECISEYKQHQRLVYGSYNGSSLGDKVHEVGTQYKDTIPNLLIVLTCCYLVPMTSDLCERGFSTQNRIKSKFRTRLNNKSLNDLMRISEDGPLIKDTGAKPALNKSTQSIMRF